MTLLNVHIKEGEKEKIQKFVDGYTDKSMSEFVRSVVDEKIKMEKIVESLQPSEDPEIPDYIPENKYVVFVKGAVVAVGDSPSDLADIAFQKFPNFSFVIKFNGAKSPVMEYVYMSLLEWNAWKYVVADGITYPLLPLELLPGNGK